MDAQQFAKDQESINALAGADCTLCLVVSAISEGPCKHRELVQGVKGGTKTLKLTKRVLEIHFLTLIFSLKKINMVNFFHPFLTQ